MLVHALAIGDPEAREACDYLSRLTWKQRRRRLHRERQTCNRLRLAKQQLCTFIMLFCTFLCRRCTTTTWKRPNFTFCRGRERRQRLLFFFSWTLIQSSRIQLQKICQHLTNWTSWNTHDKVWSGTNSLFKWSFRRRRRRCCLSSLKFDKTQ